MSKKQKMSKIMIEIANTLLLMKFKPPTPQKKGKLEAFALFNKKQVLSISISAAKLRRKIKKKI